MYHKKPKNYVRLPKLTRSARIFEGLIDHILEASDPYNLVRNSVYLKNERLIVKEGKLSYDLSRFDRILVIGGGKASGRMALALDDLLGDRIYGGVVNIGKDQKFASSRIKFFHAGHPLPNSGSVKGVKEMLKLIGSPDKKDLIICLFSGGGSAMMELPASGISLSDIKRINELLLSSGADINEINKVRKHISQVKGGQLAERLYPANILSLIISDVVGDKIDVIASGPTSPDSSTFSDAMEVLVRRKIISQVPPSIIERIKEGVQGRIKETPKPGDKVFSVVKNVIIASNKTAISAAKAYLTSEGFRVKVQRAPLVGEAKDAGYHFAKKLITIAEKHQNKLALIAGGETTVKLFENSGSGGRNQEFALSAAIRLKKSKNLAMVSLATDGIDGPTDAAGAYADSSTIKKADKIGINAELYLRRHDSYNFFKRAGGLIITGMTGTNLNDIAAGIRL